VIFELPCFNATLSASRVRCISLLPDFNQTKTGLAHGEGVLRVMLESPRFQARRDRNQKVFRPQV
jgi:hypothetical protein